LMIGLRKKANLIRFRSFSLHCILEKNDLVYPSDKR
jgi:hypothetical protein